MIRPLRPLLGIFAIVLVSVISGCGSDAPSETATGAPEKLTARDKAVKFSACVRAHGVSDFPDPDAKGDYQYGVSVTPAVFTKAVGACKDLQPPGALSSKRTRKEQATSLEFADCIREHGVRDFPDPVDGEPLVNTDKIPSSNTANGMTVLNAAMRACRGVAGSDG